MPRCLRYLLALCLLPLAGCVGGGADCRDAHFDVHVLSREGRTLQVSVLEEGGGDAVVHLSEGADIYDEDCGPRELEHVGTDATLLLHVTKTETGEVPEYWADVAVILGYT
jgi:hypothetical protein